MNYDLVKSLLAKNTVSVGELVRQRTAASYSIYSTAEELHRLGIASFESGTITLLDNPVSSAFKRLFFEGVDIGIFSKKNIEFLLLLLEPKTVDDIARETGKSPAQANRRVRALMQFLRKDNGRYSVSKSNSLLFEFLMLVRKKNAAGCYWEKGGEMLLKLPLDFKFNGALTAFSRFSDFGLMISPSHNFVFQPKRELGLEEILAHAIRFSEDANGLLLCILFYLKNKAKMDSHEIEKNCEKLGVIGLWLDMASFLEDQPVKDTKMFLPRKEFSEKAAVYGIRTAARFGGDAIRKIFQDAGENLGGEAKVFLIGGNALIEYGAKSSTKDIDAVALSWKDAEKIAGAFKKIGFRDVAGKEIQYAQLGASAMLEKAGFPRIDLFARKICNALEFSEDMQKRSRIIKEGKLSLHLASIEDIFLLKSISPRDSDLVDCENILLKSRLDWGIVHSEIIKQEANLSGKEFVILDHFEALENRLGIRIPITKGLTALCLEKGILFMAKKPVSIREIMEKMRFPEPTVRNMVQRLVKAKKLAKISGKPFRMVVADGTGR